MRASARLPLGPFFAWSSILLALLAVVFAGKGIAALQEAGKLPINPVDLPAMPALGIHPTLQSLLLQGALLLVAVAAFAYTRRSATRAGS